ncbi:hypothetical protein [Piscibacillus halophilus]|uniref:Uncharacterized protein n=1 Tax=Piscibacillus halophilus TaxID=571933 RepID=A0A1H9FI21_9BACI|nr:hypothetical protein [Piscibacillus halophilus]SEQ37123.1 hypothetical protein SAMN05216362_11223 [Piscibacillus halophilus]
MIDKKVLLVFLTLPLFILLTGCLDSEEDVLEESNTLVKDVFLSDEVLDKNFELNRLEMYKPDSLEFSEARDQNLIFYENSQPFILFINELEAPNSKWYYNELQEKDDELHLRTFETDDEFAYFSAEEKEDDQFEVQVGIGGVKMATLTNISDLKEDVQEMMKMVKSIEKK